MNQKLFDLYADYLLCSFGQTSATNLSNLVDGDVSHDQVTRLLANNNFDSALLWKQVKQTVRSIEQDDGVVIFDDTIQEKQHSKENELITWHFDHTVGRAVKGINLLNCLYASDKGAIPVAYELIKKPVLFSDLKTKKVKRKSVQTKNDDFRDLLGICCKNQLNFKYVLADSWFSSKENMNFVVDSCQRHFIFALKSNRTVFLAPPEQKTRTSQRLDSLLYQEGVPQKAWIPGVGVPVLLYRQVFKNKDGSEGILYLACSDLTCDGSGIETIYQKRWKVEVFHKTLKSNASMAKSPTKKPKTQSNHVFMSIYSAYKLEVLSLKTELNHFTLKGKMYVKAIQAAFSQLKELTQATA